MKGLCISLGPKLSEMLATLGDGVWSEKVRSLGAESSKCHLTVVSSYLLAYWPHEVSSLFLPTVPPLLTHQSAQILKATDYTLKPL